MLKFSDLDFFHGTVDPIKEGPRAKFYSEQRRYVPPYDFGEGFYLNLLEDGAKQWAVAGQGKQGKKTDVNVCEPLVYKFVLPDIPEKENVNIYRFLPNVDWSLFVAYERTIFNEEINKRTITSPRLLDFPYLYSTFKEIEETADFIVGPIADDSFWSTVDKFLNEEIGAEEFSDSVFYSQLGTQVTVKSQKWCDRLFQKSMDFLSQDDIERCKIIIKERENSISFLLQRSHERNKNKSTFLYDILKQKDNEYKDSGNLDFWKHWDRFPFAEEMEI